MQIYQIDRKLMPASTVCHIAKGALQIEAVWSGTNNRITGAYDLADVISKYSEDHGCIALCYSPKFKDELIWHETTRFSCADRIPSNRSYTSAMEIGLSVNDTASLRGRHNAASPSSVLKQRLDAVPFLYLLTPVRECAVEDAIVIFHGVNNEPDTPDSRKTTHTIFLDEGLQTPPVMSSLKMFLETWLPIELNGPATIPAGTSADFTIAAPEGATIYLEATAGLINRSRAHNGQKFSLDTRGLEVGEQLGIKTGYKFWPSITTKSVALT